MRTPKFKAWHKAEKVMCDVSVINFDKGAFLIGVLQGKDEIYDDQIVIAPDNGRFCDWDEIELCESTSLLDKNGVEIYEGSIYKRILDKKNKFTKKYEWADYWLIEWLDKSACFTTTCIGDEEETGFVKKKYIKRNDFSKRFNEMDIYIGNIHENPELI